MKVFSFSIYGDDKKYLLGLLKNIEIIREHYPDFHIFIYADKNLNEEYKKKYQSYDNVKYMEFERENHSLMCNRFFAIDDDEVEIAFIRDADSRIHERDRWCINEFLKSDKLFHIIRDNHWHKLEITGGLWGIKKGCLIEKISELLIEYFQENKYVPNYDNDQQFLRNKLYSSIRDKCLIHSNISGLLNEKTKKIKVKLENNNFCGNVVLFNSNDQEYNQFNYYDFPLSHLQWLDANRQFKILSHITDDLDIFKFNEEKRRQIIFYQYLGSYYRNRYDLCQKAFKLFEYVNVDESHIKQSNYTLQISKKKIIASFDENREPNEDEIIIYYGNYCFDYNCLPHSNKIYRHPKFFFDIKHNSVEYDSSWEKIDRIYILNLVDRVDRWYEILIELCHMKAPLNRIYKYEAKKETVTGDKTVDIYYGASKNHEDVVKHFIDNNYQYGLVLEDDICFNLNYKENLRKIKEVLDRNYDFYLLFLAYSRYGEVITKDDLVNISYQSCTTSSAYIIQKSTAEIIYNILKEGCEKILETKNFNRYVCDRYWCERRNENKILLMRNKIAYQRPTYSSITSQTNCNFD